MVFPKLTPVHLSPAWGGKDGSGTASTGDKGGRGKRDPGSRPLHICRHIHPRQGRDGGKNNDSATSLTKRTGKKNRGRAQGPEKTLLRPSSDPSLEIYPSAEGGEGEKEESTAVDRRL